MLPYFGYYYYYHIHNIGDLMPLLAKKVY